MKQIWKILSWVFVVCGMVAYLLGWFAVFTKTALWGVRPEFWFYDGIAAALFGIFFLLYGVLTREER